MKTILQIAELNISDPCHEDWDKMLPEERGKFCLSCKKAVLDFTTKSKEEILEFFKKSKLESACVRVYSDVLNQPIVTLPTIANRKISKRLVRFAYALYIAFGSLLFSCNTANQSVVGQVEYVYDGKNFATGQDQTAEKSEQKIQEESKLVSRKIKQNKKQNQSVAFTDTITLPNVNVNDKIDGIERLYSVGCMGYSVTTAYLDLNDSTENKADTALTSNVALTDELSAFPNPTSGQFQIHYRIAQATPLQVNVFNGAGQFVKQVSSSDEMQQGEYTEQIDLTSEPAGMYFVKMQMPGKTLTRKVIVAH